MSIGLLTTFFRYVVVPVVCSTLILLLVLKVSKRCREVFLARFVLPVLHRYWKPAFDRIRQEVIDTLNELESHDEKLRKANCLRLLEVGIGSGSNFKGIRREIELTAVDPNVTFESGLMDNLKKYPNIHLQRLVRTSGEDMHQVPSSSVDVVLITHVLCSVTDPKKVLAEVRRVLVPGGKFLFLEHIPYPEGTWTFRIQQTIAPVWEVVLDGCRLSRQTLRIMEAAGFAELCFKDVNLPIPRLVHRHIYGSATKGKD